MEELELNRINANSPYIVELDFSTGLFKFVSDFGVSFSVAFEKDELLQSGESYQFALTNYEGTKSPRDSKVRETVLWMNSFVKIKLHYYIYVKLAMECKK